MSDQPLRVIFAGTPAFAAAHLQALLDSQGPQHQVVAVYTQPDRRAGRGKKLSPSPVKSLALDHGLPVHQPQSLNSPEQQDQLASLQPDVMVVVAYGLLLPPAILAVPRHGCINVHASLLPRWRGAAPVEWAVLAGDPESGISIMQMDAGLDTGDVLLTLPTPVRPEDTTASLAERLCALGCEGLLQVLQQIRAGQLKPVPQDDTRSTYATKLRTADALIDWEQPASRIQRRINAFYPRSPAFSFIGGERVRLLAAEVTQGLTQGTRQARSGTLLAADKQGLLVACGEASALLIHQLQLAGKKPVSVAELLNARREAFAPGQRFTGTSEA